MKSVRIPSFSGPYFPAFGLNTERYSEYGHISRSDSWYLSVILSPLSLKEWLNTTSKEIFAQITFWMSDKKLEQYNLIIKTHAKLNSIKNRC